MTSVAGADFSAAVVVVLGISHLFADGLSMGLGDYMSSQAEVEYTESERKREKWEMDNNMSQSTAATAAAQRHAHANQRMQQTARCSGSICNVADISLCVMVVCLCFRG